MTAAALPPLLADRGPCLRCLTAMAECWDPDNPRVCCSDCEHGKALDEAEVLAILDVCAYTLSDTLGDPGAHGAEQWAQDDARWLWEAPQALRSDLPLHVVRAASFGTHRRPS